MAAEWGASLSRRRKRNETILNGLSIGGLSRALLGCARNLGEQ